MKQLNPLSAARRIHETYARYLQTLYPIKDAELKRQFAQLVSGKEQLVKGPYLEATPPYKAGQSIQELMAEGVLSPLFSMLESEHLPLARSLYVHQETAIRKIVAGRNLIVATGTGSGKTETFLIPVLHHLLEEKHRGTLSPGVRALLLYPMNALANDQMKRLRALLENCAFITFGRYTGETLKGKREAEDDFRKNAKGEPRIVNELLSREEMHTTPPHLLLTNYAMLEYLMLRPADSVFFDGEAAQHWKFIVMDEVHTYDGAKGIETAMLLRRLKDRIARSERGRIQCIGTSATLGGGRKDFPAVVKFGEQLFNERFEWRDDDASHQDVVEASRIRADEYPSTWGAPQTEFYVEAQSLLESNSANLAQLAALALERGIPEHVIRAAREQCGASAHWFLYETLRGDANVKRLREMLSGGKGEPGGPKLLAEAARLLLADDADAPTALTALVNLAVQARPAGDHAPLLPARYHLFVKALEGGFVAFVPEKQLFLNRHKELEIDGEKFPVFEIAPCKRCGAIHLVGVIEDDLFGRKLRQSQKLTEENRERAGFFLLQDSRLDAADEDEEIAEPELVADERDETYRLCLRCGAIQRTGGRGEWCACDPQWERAVVKASNDNGIVTCCRACGARSPNLVRRFLTGQDAPPSVLVTALYQEIPEREAPKSATRDDEYEYAVPQPARARKLLIFSDSRQDAAYFAPYLSDITYLPILWRRLIVLTLGKHARDIIENPWTISDLVEPLRKAAAARGILTSAQSKPSQKREAWRWALLELIAQDRRNSLEGLGLARFSLAKPEAWATGKTHSAKLAALLSSPPFGFSQDELWNLYQVLLDSFRWQSAIAFPDDVSPDDDLFKPRNRAYYFREAGASPKRHIFSWGAPAKGKLNRRVDFVTKLLQRCASGNDVAEPVQQILRHVWESFVKAPFWKPYFLEGQVAGEGTAYQLQHDQWGIRPTFDSSYHEWHECEACGNLSPVNLRGVCPTYACQGTLRPVNPATTKRDNHYRRLYLSLEPLRMECHEHTAQLTGQAASELQNRFVRGEVNVLSCSTTFELGVDVGALESVFMRNVPPSPANYIQRAGRAGRRTDSTAFALTYCQRRSHDLSHFKEPEKVIAGTIRPPMFEVRNRKIIERHLHAVALALFWRQHPSLFGKVKNFFFEVEGRVIETGDEFFDTHPLRRFIKQRPPELLSSLKRILKEQHEEYKIESWGWLDGFLMSREDAALRKAADEIYGDVAELEAHWKELSDARQPSDYVRRTITTIQSKDIIGFLASRGVLPKYGFPVDVVELQLLHHGEAASKLELQRDLRLAISDYAPESQVVANGRVWTSYALKRPPKREWRKYKYAICAMCNSYQRVDAASGQELDRCKNCKQSLRGKRTFVIPEFGFVASHREPSRPSESRPQKTYATQVYYTDIFARQEQALNLQFGSVMIEAKAIIDGQLAVLNRAGFKLCFRCGYAETNKRKTRRSATPGHKTAQGKECGGALNGPIDLGHEFRTDVLRLDFAGHHGSTVFWLSLLYGLLEGASESLSVARSDLDGCLYPQQGSTIPSLVLFDNVPGGAGHVRRIAESPEAVREMLRAARDKLDGRCGCGEETSCYGCLQNYQNQFFHDDLSRGDVHKFLNQLFNA